MLAVTTRNKLRSRRFFVPMLYASWQVRRQLAQTPGIVRFATGIAGLTEFYTLTIWESKTAMFQFTASGNHRQMMWLFSRWSDSFWAMRWRPTPDEAGYWDNLRLNVPDITNEDLEDGPAWLTQSQVAEILAPHIDIVGRPDKRELDPTTCGVTAVLAYIPTYSPFTKMHLQHIIQPWRNSPDLLRFTVGSTTSGYLLVSLWPVKAMDEVHKFMDKLTMELKNSWLMRFAAGNYEIGNWDGLRLRSFVRRHKEIKQIDRRQ